MEQWAGYFIIQRIVDNLNEANWATLIDEVNLLQGVSELNQPYEKMHGRGAVDGFYIGTGEFDEDEEEILAWYSNIYIYAARFATGAIDFDKFQNRLVNLFGVNPEDVTYTTAHNPVKYQRYRPSVIATYKYNTESRIRVELMGCASDSELCTRHESNEEVKQVIDDFKAVWGEIVS